MLSADHLIIQRSSDGLHENNVSFTIRDTYSGVGYSCPRRSRSSENNAADLKHFVGRGGGTRPKIVVKSDAADEITKAVRDNGWLPEPSLPNRFPHNAVHERWIQSVKSVVRAAILQSGFPEVISHWATPFAAIALSLKQPCPIQPHEKDAAEFIDHISRIY